MIVPDDKDWTWVLERACPECGFDAGAFPRDDVPALIEANAEGWPGLAAAGGEWFGVRPRADRWSGLEYACHVRDVFRLYEHRLRLMLEQDDPTYPNWDQDATAVEERYGEQPVDEVMADLVAAGRSLAAAFAEVAADPTGTSWERTGNRSDGARFTVETFARYLVHDPVHHVWDVHQGLAALTSRPRPPVG